jgi:HKD family nuclease
MIQHAGLVPSPEQPTAFDVLCGIAERATRLWVAVAFVTATGVELVEQLLAEHPGLELELVARGAPITEPQAVTRLADLGAVVSLVVGDEAARFHPKLWLAHQQDGALRVLSGSGNLTAGGLRDNDEQFDLLHVDADDTAAIAAQGARFAELTRAAVPLATVCDSAYWKLWQYQLDQRRKLAAEARKLDEALVRAADTGLAVDALYADLVDFYERTKAEVRIPAAGGGTRPYVASYFKRAIDDSRGNAGPVPVVARMVKGKTEGYGHLAEAGRPDLMVESLVIDSTKSYHRLFPRETVAHAQRNLDDYAASRLPAA